MAVDTMVGTDVDGSGDDVVVDKGHGQGPPPEFVDPPFGPGGDGNHGGDGQPVGNALLAMLLFLGADVMLFAGLIGAFVVFRFGADDWPPPNQPLLPVGVTGVNTAILLFSGYTMWRTWRMLKQWNRTRVLRGLALTSVLGLIFLIVQGNEWIRLLGFGLSLSSSIYGATFYTIIGCHAVHVLVAVIWLLTVLVRMNLNPYVYGPKRTVGIKMIGVYWYLVVALWPILYVLVYLN
ncbi:MAG: heme-copper oxidase subunit III [bacterium]